MDEIEAILLTAPGCPHCSSVKQALEKLQAEGMNLAVKQIDISQQPEVAEHFGVRSVPWLQLGMFELPGAWTVAELRHWAGLAWSDSGMREYLAEMLGTGQLDIAQRVIRRHPRELPRLLELLVDSERDINVHIGISALFEGMRGESILANHLEDIAGLTKHPEARVRADACHYLMLTQDEHARKYIKPLCDDVDASVREIAAESLEELLEEGT